MTACKWEGKEREGEIGAQIELVRPAGGPRSTRRRPPPHTTGARVSRDEIAAQPRVWRCARAVWRFFAQVSALRSRSSCSPFHFQPILHISSPFHLQPIPFAAHSISSPFFPFSAHSICSPFHFQPILPICSPFHLQPIPFPAHSFELTARYPLNAFALEPKKPEHGPSLAARARAFFFFYFLVVSAVWCRCSLRAAPARRALPSTARSPRDATAPHGSGASGSPLPSYLASRGAARARAHIHSKHNHTPRFTRTRTHRGSVRATPSYRNAM